jgi:ubiquinone/menaquinone biosynthesis C-methylase UbiE
VASVAGVRQYVQIAQEVAARAGDGPVLDWGAGWGQTSLLLAAGGADVVAYDVEDKGAAEGLLAGSGARYVVDAGARLPFPAGTFAVVLNCGVLEHVDDPPAALAELRRVLRPGGWLLTYHLPNRRAWTEWVARRLGWFHHDRTYSAAEAVGLFEAAGFAVESCRPFHLLPRNAWGRAGDRLARSRRLAAAWERADAALLRAPGLARLATAWAVVARRPA